MKKERSRLIAKLPATSCRCQAIDHSAGRKRSVAMESRRDAMTRRRHDPGKGEDRGELVRTNGEERGEGKGSRKMDGRQGE